MTNIINFLDSKDIKKTKLFSQFRCSIEEALVLRVLTKEYLDGNEEVVVNELLKSLFTNNGYEFLKKLPIIRNLLELGWIVQNSFLQLKLEDISNLEFLNSSISLSPAFLKLLESGSLDLALPEVKPYNDHLEYLQDQFFRIGLYQKLSAIKQNFTQNSPNLSRLKSKLKLLEKRVEEKIKVTEIEIALEKFFVDNHLDEREQILFLALLKEEYSAGDENLRDMNALIDLISFDDYERIKNRELLDEGANLIEKELIDYDEIINPFGGISRSFFIPEPVLHKIIHPHKKKKSQKIKLDTLIKEQDIFEFIEPKSSLENVVLHKQTRDTLENLLKQVEPKVSNLLKEWGIKDKKKGIEAKIIFYGPAGTGKTLTALSFAKSIKRQVLSFDCSKILSMYVGESEKNVRKIFDTYKDLSAKTKSEPVLLLNEADQFLSARSSASSSADKMHNQMQNIFLEQIERYEGILIATTNLLDSIDSAFSRRFNYKIEFKKPDFTQRVELWKLNLPKNADYDSNFNIEELAKTKLTGGQIHIIVKNTAYKVATRENPKFFMQDFVTEIQKEISGSFEGEKMMGFV